MVRVPSWLLVTTNAVRLTAGAVGFLVVVCAAMIALAKQATPSVAATTASWRRLGRRLLASPRLRALLSPNDAASVAVAFSAWRICSP